MMNKRSKLFNMNHAPINPDYLIGLVNESNWNAIANNFVSWGSTIDFATDEVYGYIAQTNFDSMVNGSLLKTSPLTLSQDQMFTQEQSSILIPRRRPQPLSLVDLKWDDFSPL